MTKTPKATVQVLLGRKRNSRLNIGGIALIVAGLADDLKAQIPSIETYRARTVPANGRPSHVKVTFSGTHLHINDANTIRETYESHTSRFNAFDFSYKKNY